MNKKRKVKLNQSLINQQKLTDEDVEALVISHELKEVIFDMASNASEIGNKKALKMLANMFELLEFEQQTLWKFDRNSNFHYWFDIPGCSCPKMDNRDRIGTEYRIMIDTCPIHGGFIQDEESPLDSRLK